MLKKNFILILSIIFIFSILVSSSFAEQTGISKQAKPSEKGEIGSISGNITRINKPDMTITVQNPQQGMEISVTSPQIRGLNVGDRVMVKYIMKEGNPRAIKITKLPGTKN